MQMCSLALGLRPRFRICTIQPANRNGASLTIENGLLGIAFDGVGNVFQEFVFHKLSCRRRRAKPIGAQP